VFAGHLEATGYAVDEAEVYVVDGLSLKPAQVLVDGERPPDVTRGLVELSTLAIDGAQVAERRRLCLLPTGDTGEFQRGGVVSA
jgi:hypothetical protein